MNDSQDKFFQAFDLLCYENSEEEVNEAIRIIESLASDNYCDAIFELSNQYKNGRWLSKNPEKAEELLVKAFNCGCESSASNLALNFIEKSDWENALKYLNLGAENNEAFSLVKLGELYENGGFDGIIQQNWNKSLEFYERASNVISKSQLSWQENKGKIGVYSVRIKIKNSSKQI